MNEFKHVYGIVPSRRLGISLGVSPIPKKACNYSCIYCQLGRTDNMTNTRQMFYPVKEILKELEDFVVKKTKFDVVTIVGEGEPTLYSELGRLIRGIGEITDKKPLAVITNGALLYDVKVQEDLGNADIVLPTLDAYNEETFKKINRPHGSLEYPVVAEGLEGFSKQYKGQLWLEIMLLKGINDDDEALNRYSDILKRIEYDRLYINTPIRPPAEAYAVTADRKSMRHATEILGGVSIDLLVSEGFHSDIKDDYEAVLNIIRRHPMNQFEIAGFLGNRGNKNVEGLLDRLQHSDKVVVINYKGYDTYRLK